MRLIVDLFADRVLDCFIVEIDVRASCGFARVYGCFSVDMAVGETVYGRLVVDVNCLRHDVIGFAVLHTNDA